MSETAISARRVHDDAVEVAQWTPWQPAVRPTISTAACEVAEVSHLMLGGMIIASRWRGCEP